MKLSKAHAQSLPWGKAPLKVQRIPEVGDLVRVPASRISGYGKDEPHVGIIVNAVQDHDIGNWYFDIVGGAGVIRTSASDVYLLEQREKTDHAVD